MRSPETKQRKPRWLHVLAVGIGILACFCIDEFGYGWGASAGIAAVALIFPAIIYYRKTGKRERFWLAVVFLAIAQVPLVIAVRPLMKQLRAVFLLVFGAVDWALVAFGIFWACSGGTSADLLDISHPGPPSTSALISFQSRVYQGGAGPD
jgi:hypothetical protein